MSDKNICMRLDGCWTMPWRKLSTDQKQAWLEALGPVGGDKGKDGRSWGSRTVPARQNVAANEDARRDQERDRERERSIGWWDATLDAHYWWAMKDVTPRDAAMVLCGLNPLSPHDQQPERTYTDGDESWPIRYGVLLRGFEGEARAVSKRRTLVDWLGVAKQLGVSCHSWVDEYSRVRKAIGEPLPIDSTAAIEPGDGCAGLPPNERRAELDMRTQRGCRRRILEMWDDIEKAYGTHPDGRQVLRVLSRDKGEKQPNLKTVQNHLARLKKEKLIP